jgi:sec-independent protein translocase protein TatB
MGTPLPIEAATIGWADSLILMLLALVVFGPRKLPQLGRQMGKLMYEFRKASNDFKYQMEEELRSAEESDRRKREEAERQSQLALTPPGAEAAADSSSTSDAASDDEKNPYSGYTEYVKEQERQMDEVALSEPASEAPTKPATEAVQAESQLSYSATPAEAAVPTAATQEKSSATEPVQNHG